VGGAAASDSASSAAASTGRQRLAPGAGRAVEGGRAAG